MPFELSWRPGGSVGFLINLFGFFELTMVVVRGREVSKTSLPVTPAQVADVLSSSPLFEGVTLASMPHIMKASPSSDMSVI